MLPAHPNIVKYFTHWEEEKDEEEEVLNKKYILMELCEGGNVFDVFMNSTVTIPEP